jgi:hypothetical protein
MKEEEISPWEEYVLLPLFSFVSLVFLYASKDRKKIITCMFDFDVYVSIDSPLAKNSLSLIYIWMVHKHRKDLDYNSLKKKKMEVYDQ